MKKIKITVEKELFIPKFVNDDMISRYSYSCKEALDCNENCSNCIVSKQNTDFRERFRQLLIEYNMSNSNNKE